MHRFLHLAVTVSLSVTKYVMYYCNFCVLKIRNWVKAVCKATLYMAGFETLKNAKIQIYAVQPTYDDNKTGL